MKPTSRRFELISSSVFKGQTKTVSKKLRDGSTKRYRYPGSWQFQIVYKLAGIRRSKDKRGFSTKASAKLAMEREISRLKGTRGRSQESERKDFQWLAEQCERSWLRPAEYAGSRTHGRVMTGGLKSYATVRSQLTRLREFFADALLDDIEPETLETYKRERLGQFVMGKARDGSPRRIRPISLATVHRELALARRILLYGYDKGWIEHDPFRGARGLIATRHEEVRSRLLSLEEETRLLAACSGEFKITYTRTLRGKAKEVTMKRAVDHRVLRALIVTAVETGFRLNELRHVRWQDLDEARHAVWILPGFTKTGIGRRSLLTDEALTAIEGIRDLTADLPGPFAGVGDIKKAWASIKKRAGIEDLRFHDLRATFASRTITAGVPFAIVQKLLGHSAGTVTERHYIALDDDIFTDAVQTVRGYKKRQQGLILAKAGEYLEAVDMVN